MKTEPGPLNQKVSFEPELLGFLSCTRESATYCMSVYIREKGKKEKLTFADHKWFLVAKH